MDLRCHISTIQCENPEETYEPIRYVRDYFLHIEIPKCKLQRKKFIRAISNGGMGSLKQVYGFPEMHK